MRGHGALTRVGAMGKIWVQIRMIRHQWVQTPPPDNIGKRTRAGGKFACVGQLRKANFAYFDLVEMIGGNVLGEEKNTTIN